MTNLGIHLDFYFTLSRGILQLFCNYFAIILQLFCNMRRKNITVRTGKIISIRNPLYN